MLFITWLGITDILFAYMSVYVLYIQYIYIYIHTYCEYVLQLEECHKYVIYQQIKIPQQNPFYSKKIHDYQGCTKYESTVVYKYTGLTKV